MSGPGSSHFVEQCLDRGCVFDVAGHRANFNYSRRENTLRILWALAGGPWMRWSPRLLYEPRNILLRAFGARIGRSVRIYPSVDIAQPWNLWIGDEVTIAAAVCLYSLGLIQIGSGSMISQRAHLCAGTHDYLQTNMPLVKRGIRVGEATWICADAFLGPGVDIGPYCIVGARAVVLGPFPAFSIVGGNPARRLKSRPVPASSPTSIP